MLSRVADSLFWLGRNVERAETVARVLDVNASRAMDLYARQEGLSERLWSSVMRSVGFVDDPGRATAAATFAHCAFDDDNGASIVSSVRIARTNALGVRAELTTEVWEVVNALYLHVDSLTLAETQREGPAKFLRRVRDWMQAFAGISDGTLTHGDGWNFLQVGRYLERAYLTARILEALDVEHEPWHESQRLLEMCCASVPFAQASHRTPEARDAVAFLALSQDCPRSLRFAVREIDAAMARIARVPAGTDATPAGRRAGRLRARFDYTHADELLRGGAAAFAASIVRELELLSSDVEDAYFPRLPAAAV